MVAVPELQQLARLVTGEPRAALLRLLVLACEQLAMDVAFVSRLTPPGSRTVRLAVYADGSPLPEGEGLLQPLSDTWCGRVVAEGSLMVRDVADRPDLRELPVTAALGIVSYVGVVLRDRDRAAIGTLCALGHAPHDSLNERDRQVLLGLGEVIAPLVQMLDAPAVPAPRRAVADLAGVADAVSGARDVEQLSRPLLDALHDLTGLASAYLTVIHEDEDVQEIRYSAADGAGDGRGRHRPADPVLDPARGGAVAGGEPAGDGKGDAVLALYFDVDAFRASTTSSVTPQGTPSSRRWVAACTGRRSPVTSWHAWGATSSSSRLGCPD